MTCRFCGRELEEQAVSCPHCGYTLTEETQPTEAVAAPKRKKGPLIAAILAGVALVAVVAVVLNLNALIGFVTKTFMTPKEYLAFVETKQVASYGASVWEWIDKTAAESLNTDSLSFEQRLDLTVGETLSAILSLSSDADAAFLNELGIALSTTLHEDLSRTTITVDSALQSLFTSEILIDNATGDQYLLLDGLNDRWLLTQGEAGAEDGDSFDLSAVDGISPTEEQVLELIGKYVSLALEQMNNVTSTDDTLLINGLEQRCTVLTVHISEQTLLDTAYAILSDIKTDATVKELIESEEALGAEGYTHFVEAIDEALLKLVSARTDASSDDLLTYSDYVDQSHNIIGRELIVDGETVVFYGNVQNGNDTAMLLSIGTLTLEGSASEHDGILNGSYDLAVDGTVYAHIALTDMNTDAFTGNIRITPSDELFGGNAALSMLGLTDPSLTLAFSEAEQGVKLFADLRAGDETLLGITYSLTVGDGDASAPILLPDADSTVDAADTLAAAQWIADWDIDGFAAALEANGLSQTVIDTVKSMLVSYQLEALYDTPYYDDIAQSYADELFMSGDYGDL